MGRHQRVKGASYERELCRRLTAHTRTPVGRVLGQARDGGPDILIDGWALEAKRRAALPALLTTWWQQATTAATHHAARPAVIMRGDGGESLVLCRLEDWLSILSQEPDVPAHHRAAPDP